MQFAMCLSNAYQQVAVRDKDHSLGAAEMGIYYSVVAVLLSATLASFRQRNSLDGGKQMLRVLNELLIGRMLAQILHTARISSRSDVLVAEPFLVVGLIASIRRILVLVTLAKAEAGTNDRAIAFRNSMTELGLLSLLVPVLGVSITLLRCYPPAGGEAIPADRARR